MLLLECMYSFSLVIQASADKWRKRLLYSAPLSLHMFKLSMPILPVPDEVMPTPQVVPVYVPVEVGVAVGLTAATPQDFAQFRNTVMGMTSGFPRKAPREEQGRWA